MAEMRWVGAAGASNTALSFPLVPRGVGSAGLRLRRLTILFITMLAGLCRKPKERQRSDLSTP